ncbi:hypothetical protein [Mycolicibacterium diernhoferi]|uniref:Uncharacterized protein n=1 Tax=Mycolicibacterium diernhoferi TaxID=1801 RepID=A0A1Q4HFU9_9MYCO|nr:hypothetical protein [Mycolicibacterium diernhoferi]OJZ66424.1 hypothetical protein BRW64_09095 [Mycolicibacterium diernhoferi]OPE56374.1 hypothetical protein BV510_00155 [Mycolicibacterium diernhoferi]PEG56299.1 hypothetical protein CRI78_00025 [Mycolicibacterium diernhoferi]QYL24597.1 hypothetical protein K0O62_10255 [Mycolicibacterium diernhoferi]
MSTDLLPPGFETLEHFVDGWVFDNADDRLKRRLTSSEDERVAFFNAVKDRLQDGLTYLDKKPFAEFDDDENRLMQLFLSFAHIALAVEVQGDAEPKHAEGARFMTITQAPSEAC